MTLTRRREVNFECIHGCLVYGKI